MLQIEFICMPGPHTVHRNDFVINRTEFINPEKLKNYQYTLDDITALNGNESYKISFKPKTSNGLFEGWFFLDVNSGAFIKTKYKLTKAGLKHFAIPFNLFSHWIDKQYLVDYMLINNKWVIKNIWRQGLLHVKDLKQNIISVSEFVTTGVDTLNASSFAYDERFQFRDFFLDKSNNLDPDFWNNYTILKENSFVEQIQDKKLNEKALITNYSAIQTPAKKTNITKHKTPYSFDIALVTLFPQYKKSNVDLTGANIDFHSSIPNSPNNSVGS
jgi:hypothetical protein